MARSSLNIVEGEHIDTRSLPRRSSSTPRRVGPRHLRAEFSATITSVLHQIDTLQNDALNTFASLSPLQKVGAVGATILVGITGVLFLVYHNAIFQWLIPYARRWRDVRGGWVLPFFLVVIISFPPMIGYSTVIMVTGFIYGLTTGWLIAATSTVVGATISYLVLQHFFLSAAERLTDRPQFQAFSQVVSGNSLKILTMLRFCPLPYSLSNAFISTIPSVDWKTFALATLFSTPKLFIHVLIGSKLGEIAEHGGEMDGKTKALSYMSIGLGVCVGLGTTALIYRSMKNLAKEREEPHSPSSIDSEQGVLVDREEYPDNPLPFTGSRYLD